MKEAFLHYLWKFKKFDVTNLQTSNHETINILHSGNYLQLAGPDFFNAQIVIGKQKWAGNVEIHVKSSDWYIHNHETDAAYDNVILHVVWEHNTEIFRKDNSEIPVLALKNYVDRSLIESYESLLKPKSWIFCEKQLSHADPFIFKKWQERLFFERLEKKSQSITELLEQTNSDWEAVLFRLLARNFGLNTNGEIFMKIAAAIPFQTIQKENANVENIEALLYGMAGLLDTEKQDHYHNILKLRFDYLSHKYKISRLNIEPVQFFKHRPDNFPTIRLSQLANLYGGRRHLFSEIIGAVSIIMLYEILGVSVSEYWKTHYLFDRESTKKSKALSKAFIDLIIINTVVPLQYTYAKSQGKEIGENVVQLAEQLAPESNAIIDKFSSFGISARNAFEAQSLLQLKNEYCNQSRCLECEIGVELLKNKTIKV